MTHPATPEQQTTMPLNPSQIARLRERLPLVFARIAPLWPLDRFVAVNPFVGLDGMPFSQAAVLHERVAHHPMLPTGEDLLRRVGDALTDAEVGAAATSLAERQPGLRTGLMAVGDAESLFTGLRLPDDGREPGRVHTVAEAVDSALGTSWSAFAIDEVSKWCASCFDQGQASWRLEGAGESPYAFWRTAAAADLTPDCLGLATLRPLVRSLPADPWEAVDLLAAELNSGGGLDDDHLHRQLLSVAGWSGHIQYRIREGLLPDGALCDLLAMRLAYDVALWRQFGARTEVQAAWTAALGRASEPHEPTRATLARLVAQELVERQFQSRLLTSLRPVEQTGHPEKARPLLHAVFCIDVRSEPLRRALEAQSTSIVTSGFAGFFGMPIAVDQSEVLAPEARCPVLLKPRYRVGRPSCHPVGARANAGLRLRDRIAALMSDFSSSAGTSFPFVETLGLGYGAALVAKTAGAIRTRVLKAGADVDWLEGIPAADRPALAEGALRGMGLIRGFARYVLLCGHAGASANNPFAASLDCGACGGHSGEANARVAVAILNDPAVRAALRASDIHIPADTVFLAGLHDTTRDEILVDLGQVAAEDREAIGAWLEGAAEATRLERSLRFGGQTPADAPLRKAANRKANDWSEVRPEWALAGNAAFIAAPRARTAGLGLGGRAFLHDYDPARDPSGSVLELILTAPVVVASWINLQYYGSTVAPGLHGSGDKTLHNVVGGLGVWEGNGADLRAGLPWQSVHDGTRWVHEPLRLTVIVEASRDAVDRVLGRHAHPENLVRNGWIHLLAIQPDDGSIWRCRCSGRWERISGAAIESRQATAKPATSPAPQPTSQTPPSSAARPGTGSRPNSKDGQWRKADMLVHG